MQAPELLPVMKSNLSLKVRITSGICNRKFCAKPMQQLNAFSYGTSITFLGNENIDNAACFGHYMFTRTIQARS